MTMPIQPRTLCATLCAWILLIVFAASAHADDTGRERRDGRRFRELQTELREASARESAVLSRAVDQARDDAGTSEPSTLAELTNVMEEKDRILHHLRELALRNGWTMPGANSEGASGPVPGGPLGRMVGRATAAVRKALAAEARRIAARLELPLIPLPPPILNYAGEDADDTDDTGDADNTGARDHEAESDDR